MSDETKPAIVPPVASGEAAKLPSLAEQSGVNQTDAARAIANMNERFNSLAADNARLSKMVVEQQAQIEKMSASSSAMKFGKVPIVMRHCNVDGTEVGEGERCPRGKNHQINEIGMGNKHNRVQPIIVRQV